MSCSFDKVLVSNRHLGPPIGHQRNCTVLSFPLFKLPEFLTLHVDPYISLQLRKFLHVFSVSNSSWTSTRWPCAVYIFEIKSISNTIRCSICLSHLGCACISHLERGCLSGRCVIMFNPLSLISSVNQRSFCGWCHSLQLLAYCHGSWSASPIFDFIMPCLCKIYPGTDCLTKVPFNPILLYVVFFFHSLEGLVFKPLDSTMALLWIRLYWYSAAGFHLYLPSRYHYSFPTTSTGKLTQKCRQMNIYWILWLLISLLYPVLYFSCKAWLRDTVIPLDAIDFQTEFTLIGTEVREDTRRSIYDKILNTIF